MKIYISGPITGIPDYRERFDEKENCLEKEGHKVLNPAKLDDLLPQGSSYDDFMNMCYAMLDIADAICMLPGWEKSKGACIEYGYARAKGLTIVDVV